MQNASHRLDYLDASRGIAALVVFLAHFQLTLLPDLSATSAYRSVLRIFLDADAAVLYFFLLSGYVLTLSLRRHAVTDGGSYVNFIGRRVFRLYPAFLLTLSLAFLLLRFIHLPTGTWLDGFWKTEPTLSSFFGQALLAFRLPNDPVLRLLPHDWTLSIEMAVAFILPFLVLFANRSAGMALLGVYAAVRLLHLDPFVFDFMLGVFMATATPERNPVFGRRSVRAVLLLAGLIILTAGYTYSDVMKSFDRKLLIHHKTIGVSLLFLLLLSSGWAQRILSSKPLVFLGRISYSVYLLHFIVLYALVMHFPAMNPLYLFVLYAVITIVLAWITYIRIERPFNRVLK